MSTDNYYKDLWNNPKTEAGQFFNKTDFNHEDYKLQEHIFRQTLVSIKSLINHGIASPIETVLEVGAGTGRMTKIMLEEFPDYNWYTIVEISKDNIMKMFKTLGNGNELPPNIYPLCGDIIEYINLPRKETDMKYDMVLLSEVLMHILPKDIDNVVSKCSKLLNDNGCIINIDWASSPEPSEWCFIHPYDQLYRNNGLQPIFITDINKQKLFCYGK